MPPHRPLAARLRRAAPRRSCRRSSCSSPPQRLTESAVRGRERDRRRGGRRPAGPRLGGDPGPRLHRRPGRRGALVSCRWRERGADRDAPETGDAYRQMAVSLDERNRQVATLAREASRRADRRRAARVVARARVRGARRSCAIATWRCAVLTSDDARAPPAGVYHGDRRRAARPSRSASSSAGPRSPDAERAGATRRGTVGRLRGRRRRRQRPPGGHPLRAVGGPPAIRRRPRSTLLTLVGQHAGTALEHSLLYAQVREPGR